jgi:hypothetical protein
MYSCIRLVGYYAVRTEYLNTCKIRFSFFLTELTNEVQQLLKFFYLSFKYSSTCFGHLHAHHQELQKLQWQLAVLLVVVGRAADLRLRPRGHWDRRHTFVTTQNNNPFREVITEFDCSWLSGYARIEMLAGLWLIIQFFWPAGPTTTNSTAITTLQR